MNTLWTSIVPRFLGLIVLGFGIWFIPRNWWRMAKTRAGGRWSWRRGWRFACWTAITLGYISTGISLLSDGWKRLDLAGGSFALAMVGFIPVPCHFRTLNRGRWRIVRAGLFLIAAALALCISRLG